MASYTRQAGIGRIAGALPTVSISECLKQVAFVIVASLQLFANSFPTGKETGFASDTVAGNVYTMGSCNPGINSPDNAKIDFSCLSPSSIPNHLHYGHYRSL